jgi:hypothetical protein
MKYTPSDPAPPNPETVIWRYIDHWKFKDLLQRFTEHDHWQTPKPGTRTVYYNDPGQLWFGFPSSFGDFKEGTFPAVNEDPETYCDRMADLLHLSPEEAKDRKDRFLAADTKSIRDCNRDMARLCGVSCWTARDTESRTMWDDFVGSRNGVAIRSTCQNLERALSYASCLAMQRATPSICEVAYVDHENYMLQYDGYRGLLSIVQQCHSHEKEVRLVCKSPALAAITIPDRMKISVSDPTDPMMVTAAKIQRLNEIASDVSQACRELKAEGFHLPISLDDLLSEVVLKPGCTADYESTVREQLKQAGCSNTTVRFSSLR